MSVKLFANQTFRRMIVLILGICCICILSVGIGVSYFSKKINQNRALITSTLEKEVGFPIIYEDIQADWMGYFTVGVTLKNIKTPFATAASIKILPDLKEFILEHELKPKKIVVTGLKLSLAWDNNHKIRILSDETGAYSKNQENSESSDLNAQDKDVEGRELLSKLSKIPIIRLRSAEIDWWGPTLHIKQFLNAKLKWNKDDEGFLITGNHKLQIRDGQVIPKSSFNLEVAPGFRDINLEVNGSNVYAYCKLEKSLDNPWQIDSTNELTHLDLANLHQYYSPAEEDPKLLQWLAKALPAGKIDYATFKITGPVDDLNWSGDVDYDKVDFQYASGWPRIEKANGAVKIAREQVDVQLQGTIMGVPIDSAHATIGPLKNGGEDTVVDVDGSLNTTLQTGLLFLQQSPLKDSIAKSLERLDPTGHMHLKLGFSIPLAENKTISIDGSVTTKDGYLKLEEEVPGLEQLKGDFHFTANGLNATDVKAVWMGHPLELSVGTQEIAKQKQLIITGSGMFSAEFLRQQWSIPLLDKLEGESLWTLTLNTQLMEPTEDRGPVFKIHSNLEGMAIHLPKPFQKESGGARDLTLTFSPVSNNERKIAINLDKTADMKIVVKGFNEQFKLKHGHIVLGEGQSDWKALGSLLIEGKIAYLNTAEWLDYFSNSSGKNIFPMIHLHLLLDKLDVNGLVFKSTLITSQFSETFTKWGFEGPAIKGKLIFPTSEENLLIIGLDYLTLKPSDVESQTAESTADLFNNQNRFPILFYCRDLQYDSSHFGAVKFNLIPKSYGYEVQNLTMDTRESEVAGQGEWHLENAKSYTKLHGRVLSSNIGKLIQAWGYPSMIREAGGFIEFDFKWTNSPFQFNINTVDGLANLKLKKGRILGVDPGLGRVLGLLNIDNIRRRLQLDFSDVFKKGFVFDKIKGQFEFKHGVVYTQELLIDGPAAKIDIRGKALLVEKTMDLEMEVLPQVGVGLPLAAAALAVGNPAIGAGVWVLDKLTGSPMNTLTSKMTQNYYHVTGSWDSPNIVELGNVRNKLQQPRKQKSRRK